MAEPNRSRRRWFQFSLSSMLWLMLVVALGLYGLREHERRRRFEAENSMLQAQIVALESDADKTQQQELAVQHYWVSEIRRMELERVLEQQPARRDRSQESTRPTP